MLNEKLENIEVLIKRPGEPAELKVIQNSVLAFAEEIGGMFEYIEAPILNCNIFYSANTSGLKENMTFLGVKLFGTVIFTGSTPVGECVSIQSKDLRPLKTYIKSNAY